MDDFVRIDSSLRNGLLLRALDHESYGPQYAHYNESLA